MALENVIASAGIRMVPVIGPGFTSSLNTKVQTAGARVAAQMASTGQKLTRSVTLPVVGLAAAIIGVGNDFESNLAKIKGLVGATEAEIDQMRDAVLELGPATGKGPGELSNALFFLKSAGLETSVAIDALEQSARASAAGLGDTAVIADAVSSVINAYGAENINAAQATDILVATVREGKLEADALAGSIGRVIPLAAAIGIEFDEVGAALAVMTRSGLDANEATTALRGIMATLLNPTQEAEEALAGAGLTMSDLRHTVTEEGLLEGLLLLKNKFGDNTEALTAIVPNIRALSGVLNIVGQDSEIVEGVFDGLANATGSLDQAFQAAEETGRFKLKVALAELQAQAAELSTVIMPFVLALVGGVVTLVGAFEALPEPVQASTLALLGFLAVMGPLLLIGSKVVLMLTKLTGGAGLVGLRIRALQAQQGLSKLVKLGMHPATIAIGVLVLGFLAWNKAQKEARKRQKELQDTLHPTTGAITDQTIAVFANQVALEENAALLGRTGIDLDVYTRALLGNRLAVEEVTRQTEMMFRAGQISRIEFELLNGAVKQSAVDLAAGADAISRENEALGDLTVGVDIATERMIEHRQEQRRNELSIARTAAAISTLGPRSEDMAERIDSSAKKATPAIRTIEDAYDDAIESQSTFAGNLLEIVNPLFGAIEAARRYDEKLIEVWEDGALAADEQAELARLSLEAQAAMDRFKTDGVVAELDIMGAALDTNREQTLGILGDLNLLDGTTFRVFVDIVPLTSRIIIDGGSGPSTVLNVTRFSARGTDLLRIGETSIVGEAGPELVRSTAGGTQIVPTSGNGVSAAGGRPIVMMIDGRAFAEGVLPHIVDVIELEAV